MSNLESVFEGKEVLINGGSGFLGVNLALRLLDYGAEVCITYYGKERIFERYLKNSRQFPKISRIDMRNKGEFSKILKGKDILFNLAGHSGALRSMSDSFIDLDVNCRGHLNVLNCCREVNPSIRIIFSGSRLQYGIVKRVPVKESDPMNPCSIYGIHKMTAEKYHLLYNKMYDLQTVCLRISNPYGPNSPVITSDYGIVNYFVKLALLNKPIKIFGDGCQIRDYIYIDDLIDAFLICAFDPRAVGQVFNMGGHEQIKFIDMAKMIVDTAKSGSIERVSWPKEYKNIDTGDYFSCLAKIKRELNWNPKICFREGIKKTIQFYQNERR